MRKVLYCNDESQQATRKAHMRQLLDLVFVHSFTYTDVREIVKKKKKVNSV